MTETTPEPTSQELDAAAHAVAMSFGWRLVGVSKHEGFVLYDSLDGYDHTIEADVVMKIAELARESGS